MYKTVFFEISGICNANCTYCVNGGHSISGSGHRKQGRQIDTRDFARAIDYMFHNQIIDVSTLIRLFNWGEPSLHPQLLEIIAILNERKLPFGISTNASKSVCFKDDIDLSRMREIYFSMPGFSQKSYDRIHGFNFEQIKQNIIELINSVRKNGFTGISKIAWHLYQFNVEEVSAAKEFAKRLNLEIIPYGAYFNGYTMFKNYLTQNMDPAVLEMARSEIFTDLIDDMRMKRPEMYVCPQMEFLTIDEYCNVLTCCAVDRLSEGYAIGSLFDLSLDEINKKRQGQKVCQECRQLGIDFLGDNPIPESIIISSRSI